MTDLSTKLAGAYNRDRYLAELRDLLRSPVAQERLLDLSDTQKILDALKQKNIAPTWELRLPFEEKAAPRFQSFIQALSTLNGSPVYLWVPLSTFCGLVPPLAISDINFDFEFNASPDGICVIFTADLSDKLLLDWGQEDGDQLVEVAVSGEHWGRARY